MSKRVPWIFRDTWKILLCPLDQLDGVSCRGVTWLLPGPKSMVTCDHVKSHVQEHTHEQAPLNTCYVPMISQILNRTAHGSQVTGSIENTERQSRSRSSQQRLTSAMILGEEKGLPT